MLTQFTFFAYADYFLSLITLFVIILLQIKIKIIEENDETPQFQKLYKLINEKIICSQYSVLKKDNEEHFGLALGKYFLVNITKVVHLYLHYYHERQIIFDDFRIFLVVLEGEYQNYVLLNLHKIYSHV